LHHAYWAIQEIVTNAIRHAQVNRVQIIATEETKQFILCVHYRATENARKWLSSNTKAGLGTLIVKDRLQIIDANMHVEIKDDVVTQTLIINK
jgi:signal transduction histidine kinase